MQHDRKTLVRLIPTKQINFFIYICKNALNTEITAVVVLCE